MADDVIAAPPAGRLRGVRDGPALRFLGIPYAQSPTVTGRFAAPVPQPGWDGVRDALQHGASSAQPDRGITIIPEPVIPGDNELNLNVFTPELGAAGLPVLVWIHGGGYFGGCNASPWYRGGAFARDGVVLVSINYRLGAPGFLEVPDAPANRAVRDWVRALEWVAENIAAFGGDPAKVTIAGQSAGGGACAALTGVPAAAGLFRGVICMSGGAGLLQTPDGVRAAAGRMREHLGVPLRRAALEELSPAAVLAAQAAVMRSPDDAPGPAAVISGLGAARLRWAPWVDGQVVTADPWQAARSWPASAVPLLAGATAHEMNARWLGEDWITLDLVRAGLARAGVPQPQLDSYLAQNASLRPAEMAGQAITDRTFRVPAQELAAAKAAAGRPGLRLRLPVGATGRSVPRPGRPLPRRPVRVRHAQRAGRQGGRRGCAAGSPGPAGARSLGPVRHRRRSGLAPLYRQRAAGHGVLGRLRGTGRPAPGGPGSLVRRHHAGKVTEDCRSPLAVLPLG